MTDRSAEPKSPAGSWADHAACIGADPDIFFPRHGGGVQDMAAKVARAQSFCRECPVRGACLDYAQTRPIAKQGVWGGLTGKERWQLRRGEKVDNPLAPPSMRKRVAS